MGTYRIADLTIDIHSQFSYLADQCRDYACDACQNPDITISVSPTEWQQEQKSANRIYPDGYLESLCAYRRICEQLYRFDGLLLHGSVIRAQEHGIAFLAPSGVGKTTHTLLWQKLLGEQCVIINGDKPIIRFAEGQPYAYGTPWAGKENYQVNDKVRLTDLCFIVRSTQNQTQRLAPEACIAPLMMQIFRSPDPDNMLKTLEKAEKLLNTCRLWRIACDPTRAAAETAYRAIMGVALEKQNMTM